MSAGKKYSCPQCNRRDRVSCVSMGRFRSCSRCEVYFDLDSNVVITNEEIEKQVTENMEKGLHDAV